ncbi:MAG: alpha/beta fold hydrolase, partial [Gammaproteobacteria bacterium]|nr:alpha/beta fold hydrolase [Gammaproteobacteria bacterium]
MTNADAFRPKVFLSNGHAQTLWRKFAPVPSVAHRRQRVELADGDFIDLDWSQPSVSSVPSVPSGTESSNNGMIILLLHGLCGCSQSSYIQSLQHRLGEAGYTSVAMNFRGCSGETNRLAKAYHSGVTADLDEVFQVLQKQYPDSSFTAAGFSLGANVLLKWLGEEGEQSSLQRAVAVSTPFNLTLCSQAMLEGLSQMYGRFFLRRLVADVEKKKAAFEQSGNQEQLELLRSCGDLTRVSSLWDFDDRVTAPLHGFDDAHDYYEQCSSIRYLA